MNSAHLGLTIQELVVLRKFLQENASERGGMTVRESNALTSIIEKVNVLANGQEPGPQESAVLEFSFTELATLISACSGLHHQLIALVGQVNPWLLGNVVGALSEDLEQTRAVWRRVEAAQIELKVSGNHG